jgi:MFS family permease
VELINLTVTMYIVMQGICAPIFLISHLFDLPLTVLFRLFDSAPMVIGTLSDRWGRRPIMFACLATFSLSCVGLALVPTSAYWLLMLLRCIQAAGSASTVVLGTCLVTAHRFTCLCTNDFTRGGGHCRRSYSCRKGWLLWVIRDRAARMPM